MAERQWVENNVRSDDDTILGGYPMYKHPMYSRYQNMIGRCYRRYHGHYYLYGARGIKVCDQWQGKGGFLTYLRDVGNPPSPNYTIDRIDNGGDYEPSNVRWASPRTQQINRGLHKNNTSGHKGVKITRTGKWNAWVSSGYGKVKYLGTYILIEDAIKARKKGEADYGYTI